MSHEKSESLLLYNVYNFKDYLLCLSEFADTSWQQASDLYIVFLTWWSWHNMHNKSRSVSDLNLKFFAQFINVQKFQKC